MSNKIDWTKPIEVRSTCAQDWKVVRFIAWDDISQTLIYAIKDSGVCLFNFMGFHPNEHKCFVRNVLQTVTKRLILHTYEGVQYVCEPAYRPSASLASVDVMFTIGEFAEDK